MDFYLWLSETQSGATFQAHQNTGAPKAKLIVHKLIQGPFVSVYLNETLRPWGCLLRKSQKCQISFFFFLLLRLLPLSPSPFFFSLIALQLRDPKILGKHPGSAALLSRSPLLRPLPPSHLCTEISGSQRSLGDPPFRVFFFLYIYIFVLFLFLRMKLFFPVTMTINN